MIRAEIVLQLRNGAEAGEVILSARMIALLLFAAAARAVLYVIAPHIETPDTAIYIATGDALFADGAMSSSLYMPLYPILIHLAGSVGIIWIQIALSTATVFFVYRLAFAVWQDSLAALWAAALCALHPMLLYFSIARLTETVAAFLLIAGLYFLYRRQVLFGSVCLVLLNLTRPTFDLILPALIVAATFATEAEPSVRLILRRMMIFASVYVILMSPWWLHNYNLYGQFVRLDLADGITLLLENNDAFERHGGDWSAVAPWAPFAGIQDPVSRNAAMRSAAFDYIQRNPFTWVRESLSRLGRFLAPWPAALTENTLRILPALAVNLACAILIVPFLSGAACSLFWSRRRWRVMVPVLVPAVFLTAVHAASYANMRYRIPIDPLLLALAGGPLAFAVRQITASLAGRLLAVNHAARISVRPPT